VKTNRSQSWSLSHEKRELRSRSHVYEKSSGGGAMTFLRWLRGPEIILNCSRAHRRFRGKL